VNDRMKFEIQQ